MKCPRCGSGKPIYHFGVYKCRKCKLYILLEEAEKATRMENSDFGRQSKQVIQG